MGDIAVLVEHRGGALRDVTLEMLAAARGLAEQSGASVEALLLADQAEPLIEPLRGLAHRVVWAARPEFASFNYESYQRAAVKYLAERRPKVLLVAHSAFGVDLGPSLAVAAGCPVISDAVTLQPEGDGLMVVRGMYSGKLNAEWRLRGEPLVVMVRQSSYKPEPAALATEMLNWDPADCTAQKTKFITIEEVPVAGVDITKATVIVAVGRGIKEEKNLAPIRELAAAMGAVLAASRPVVDAGWLPKEVQVGSSGKTVKPKLYLALGISGAFQHVAGMKGAETIIAVNKDPKAPIFATAHYGIVDDLHKVVPVLKERIKELVA